MTMSRLLTLLGGGFVVGASMTPAIRTDGLAALAAMHEASPDVPSGIPTLWSALDPWMRIAVVVFVTVAVVMALRPPLAAHMARIDGAIVAVAAGITLVIAVLALVRARQDAAALADAFARFTDAGTIATTYDAAPGTGFVLFVLGPVLAVAGGVVSVIAPDPDRPPRQVTPA